MAYAVLLDQGYEPGEALLMITQARPEAKASYAEHALDWHLNRTGATEAERKVAFESLRAARARPVGGSTGGTEPRDRSRTQVRSTNGRDFSCRSRCHCR